MKNHHIIDQNVMSPPQFKQAHSYLESNNNICHNPVKSDDNIYASFVAPAKKSKSAKHCTT